MEQKIVDLLNEMLSNDHDTVMALVNYKASVHNENYFINHPSLQIKYSEGEGYLIGLMGLLNGLFDHEHYIVAHGELERFNNRTQFKKIEKFSLIRKDEI